MVIERKAGGEETRREVKGESPRGGGDRGQKGEKRGRVWVVATSGGTNGSLMSEGKRVGQGARRKGKPPGAAAGAERGSERGKG